MVEIKAKEKRKIRAILKTRPVDLKVGKRGLTPEFIRECAKIIGRDSMIKIGLPADKILREKILVDFSRDTCTQCIAKIGKTAAFYQPNE